MALKEYKPGTAFSGVIGRTVDQSEPAWPSAANNWPPPERNWRLKVWSKWRPT